MKRVHSYSHKARFQDEGLVEKRIRYAESQINILHDSEHLDRLRKVYPIGARMLERGTGHIKKCELCGKAFVAAKSRFTKQWWRRCFGSCEKRNPKQVEILNALWKEYYDYLNKSLGVTITNINEQS